MSPEGKGTKAAAHYRLSVPPEGSITVKLRLSAGEPRPLDAAFDRIFDDRRREADAFHESLLSETASEEERQVVRQGYAVTLSNWKGLAPAPGR